MSGVGGNMRLRRDVKVARGGVGRASRLGMVIPPCCDPEARSILRLTHDLSIRGSIRKLWFDPAFLVSVDGVDFRSYWRGTNSRSIRSLSFSFFFLFTLFFTFIRK